MNLWELDQDWKPPTSIGRGYTCVSKNKPNFIDLKTGQRFPRFDDLKQPRAIKQFGYLINSHNGGGFRPPDGEKAGVQHRDGWCCARHRNGCLSPHGKSRKLLLSYQANHRLSREANYQLSRQSNRQSYHDCIPGRARNRLSCQANQRQANFRVLLQAPCLVSPQAKTYQARFSPSNLQQSNYNRVTKTARE